MSPWPVRKISGSALSIFLSASCNSSPLKPGIWRSTIAQPGESAGGRLCRNLEAESKVLTSYPPARNNRVTAVKKDASSSTT